MGNRTAKFISTLFASMLAGAPLSAVSQTSSSGTSASTANECLASPNKTAPDGQHWFYRLDRGTKRQCWYLRAQGAKTTQSAQAPAAQKSDAPAARTVQDARAEWTQGSGAQNATVAAASPSVSAPQSPAVQPQATAPESSDQQAVNTSWPDPVVAAPAPSATKRVDVRPAKPSATAAAPVALAAAEAPAEKPTGSLQTLLLVIGGALALAGILGSAVYRFAGSRVRAQAQEGARRRVNWDNAEEPAANERAPWADAAGEPTQRGAAAPQDDHLRIPLLDEADIAAIALDDMPGEPEAGAAEASEAAEETEQADEVDIDIIQMLERLVKEGPRLGESATSRAGSAIPERTLQDQPGVRA